MRATSTQQCLHFASLLLLFWLIRNIIRRNKLVSSQLHKDFCNTLVCQHQDGPSFKKELINNNRQSIMWRLIEIIVVSNYENKFHKTGTVIQLLKYYKTNNHMKDTSEVFQNLHIPTESIKFGTSKCLLLHKYYLIERLRTTNRRPILHNGH